MKNQQQILTAAQSRLAAELHETYGVKPEDIKFFTGDPEPFLGYEAQSALVNELTDIRDIDTELIQSASPDAVAVKVRLEDSDGIRRAGIGVVNTGELDGNGEPLTPQQRIYTATSRALRAALRAASIDLMQLHSLRSLTDENKARFSGKPPSNYDSLIKQVHVLGEEAGLIKGKDKTLWRTFLINRYEVASSDELSEEQLADLAAALRVFRPIRKAA